MRRGASLDAKLMRYGAPIMMYAGTRYGSGGAQAVGTLLVRLGRGVGDNVLLGLGRALLLLPG